jgi:hypothetical protein
MKRNLLQAIYALTVILCTISCARGPVIKEKPDGVVSTDPRPEFYAGIMTQFPENQNNKEKQKVLFEANVQKRVVITKETDVYVTYITEGAGNENTFGWYSYDSLAKPSSASELKLNVLFPTVSDRILKQGDRLQLGKARFPAGTVIGFFLIIKGWQDGAIHFDRQTLYTDYAFNPNGYQQHILFKQKDFGDLVLAFEDELLIETSDRDFNDIIFTVSDNTENREVSSFDMRKVSQ